MWRVGLAPEKGTKKGTVLFIALFMDFMMLLGKGGTIPISEYRVMSLHFHFFLGDGHIHE